MILEAKIKHLNSLVKLHRLVLKDTSSSKFGYLFVKKLYQTLIKNPHYSKVLVIIENKKLLGFLSATKSMEKTSKLINKNISIKNILIACFFLLTHPQEIVSFIQRILSTQKFSKINNPYPTILTLGISPKMQGKGFGKKLIKEADNYFKQNKFKFYYVDTTSTNHNAICFYNNCGFEKVLENNKSVLLKKWL